MVGVGWELRAQRHAPAGIAAAIYAVSLPEPWVLIPINAALHAGATVILIFIIRIYVSDYNKALLCVSLFFFYPSAMT